MNKEESIQKIQDQIEKVKEYIEYEMPYGEYLQLQLAFEDIVNLIEKQGKEIEELKEDNKHQWEERCKLTFKLENSTSNDKIKAKIEEYKKQIEKIEKDDIGIGFTLGKEWSDLKAKVEFGQSLLEKE